MYNSMSDKDLIKACEGSDNPLVAALAARLGSRAEALDAAREDLGDPEATPTSSRGVDRRRIIWLDFPNGELADDRWVAQQEREHHAEFVQFSEGSTRAVFREPRWGECATCPGTAPLLDGLCQTCAPGVKPNV